jgi:hypothetical protein
LATDNYIICDLVSQNICLVFLDAFFQDLGFPTKICHPFCIKKLLGCPVWLEEIIRACKLDTIFTLDLGTVSISPEPALRLYVVNKVPPLIKKGKNIRDAY